MWIHPYHVYTDKIQHNLTLKPIILNNSTQPTLATNQNIQITPQQLVNIVRQINSQSTQTINAPTPYYLQATSTKMPSPVVHRNAQVIYPYSGGLEPMQQSLRLFDGTDPITQQKLF